MAKDTRIITYLNYYELFDSIERGGIILPLNTLRVPNDLDEQITHLLSELNPVELIQFSSFLNMICQTGSTDRTMVRGVTLLDEVGLIPKGSGLRDKIVFHRENLLNLIGQVITKNINGTQQLTGKEYVSNQQNYCKAILLNNDLLTEESSKDEDAKKLIFRNHFIREWPHYYLPEIVRSIYSHRIVRYRFCYEELIQTLNEAEKGLLTDAIATFEQKMGVSMAEYLKVLSGLYLWFFDMPLQNEKNPPKEGEQKLGFDFTNIKSFYIESSLFEKDPAFVQALDKLSKDINALRESAVVEAERERDPITGFNKDIRLFFDNPVFKIDTGYYCVTDLKFVIENASSGLMWKVKGDARYQDFKSAYGRLMEEYFKFLIQKIFSGDSAQITFGEMEGADAVIETGDKIFVIEFTTEHYRLSSLYNPTFEEFVDDAYRILFNKGKDDPKSRGKAEQGKLYKLNGYIEKNKKEGKTIIPILVTENMLGNPDLFNEFDGFYDKEVSDNNLTNIQKHPPLLLSLDDLETFWSLFTPEEAIEGLSGFAEYWNLMDKGPQFHNPSAGICRFIENQGREPRINNHDSVDFFSNKRLYKN